MSLSPEMQKAFDDAAVPFIEGGGAITAEHTKMKSWRYFLEANSLCNLHCPTCTKGNQEPVDGLKYEHQTGIMARELMDDILDKIKRENPKAIVFLYGNSEPFLHPWLAGAIRKIKERGLNAQLSTNLNYVRKLDEVLAAQPDLMIVSLSGFTQEVYVKGHVGGDIEKVKANMRLLAEANAKASPKIEILVNYHVYKDNQHEVELMREYATNLGLGFFTSFARAISMENAIQYCRSLDPDATPFELRPGGPDYNAMLPPVSGTYVEAMKRLVIPPTESAKMYERLPTPDTCPIGTMFTFIRHDGKTEMCACVADRRLTLGNYLETSQDQLAEQRHGHPVCRQCSKYKLRYYFHLTDMKKWTPPV